MRKKWKTSPGTGLLAMAAAVAVLVASIQTLSVAAPDDEKGFVDLESACSLIVAYDETLEFGNDLWHQAQIKLDLYKVADATESPLYDTYGYAVKDPYKNLGIPENIEDTKDYTSEDWNKLSQEAAKVALGIAEGSFSGDEAVEGDTEEEQWPMEINLQDRGFPGLDAGLYLLIPRGLVDTGVIEGEDDERPVPGVDYTYVDVTTDEGTVEQKLVTCAYSKRYVYYSDPQLISLPNRETSDLGAEMNTADTTPWVYDVQMELKMSREYRYGNLQIIKDLLENDTLDRDSQSGWITDPATFVFEIDAVLYAQDANGEDDTQAAPLWSRTYNKAVHFTEAGLDDSILIEHIPAGAHITVTEVYSGAKYELDAEGSKTGVIDADDTISVSFANRYNRSKKNGYGITNHFEYQHSGTEGSGSWEFTGSNQGAPNAPAPAPGEPAEN